MKLMNWKAKLCVMSILIMFLVTVGFVGAAEKEVGTKWNPIKLGILMGAYSWLPSYKAIDLLNERGIFAAGYTFPSAVERLEALGGGYLNLSYAGLNASIMLSVAGKDVVVLCSVDEGGRAVVTKEKLKSLKELVGKKVGTIFGSSEHLCLVGELIKAGVNPKDVQILNFPTAFDLPIAMAAGGIDAYSTYEPLVTIGVEKYGGHILKYIDDSPIGRLNSGIETTSEFIKKYPQLTYQVVKAHVEAVEYYKKHPEEVIYEGVTRYKLPSREVAAKVMNNIAMTYDLNINQLKACGRFLQEQGYTKGQPDWDKFVDLQFLERAKKELGLK